MDYHQFITRKGFDIPKKYKKYYVSYEILRSKIQDIFERSSDSTSKILNQSPFIRLNRDDINATNSTNKLSGHFEIWKYLPDAQYERVMQNEIAKLNKFAVMKFLEIKENLFRAVEKINIITKQIENSIEVATDADLRTHYPSVNTFEKHLDHLEYFLEIQTAEIVHLDYYIRRNYISLIKIGLLYDKSMNVSVYNWFSASLLREKFISIDIEFLLIFLSFSWSQFRDAKNIKLNSRKIKNFDWAAPDQFTRSTKKYWVRQDRVVLLKALISRNLPYLIYGISNDQMKKSFSKKEAGTKTIDPKKFKLMESQPISSVYFDNENAVCYERRILRFESSRLLRFRWYGNNNGEKDKEIFVELKTHHDRWTGEESTKRRFPIYQKDSLDFMKGKLSIIDLAKKRCERTGLTMNSKKIRTMIELGHEIEKFIAEFNLKQIVRTSYLRSAFQHSDNNDVRISIDTNLCMVDELNSKNQNNQSWCRLANEILTKNEVVRFPHAVLEVKLQVDDPFWVTDVLRCCNVLHVHKFSKFQHGVAFLHREKTNVYPHWFDYFSRKPYEQKTGSKFSSAHSINQRSFNSINYPTESSIFESRDLRDSKSRYSSYTEARNSTKSTLDIKAWLQNHLDNDLQFIDDFNNSDQKIESGGLRQITYLDPKQYFAAERTFLSSISLAVYLAGMVTLPAYFPIFKKSFVSLTSFFLTTFLILYFYSVYLMRTNSITRNTNRPVVKSVIHSDSNVIMITVIFLIAPIAVLSMILF